MRSIMRFNNKNWTLPVPPAPVVPNDEIWYTSSDGNIVTPYEINSLPEIDTNTYSDGKGVIKFKTDVSSIGYMAFQFCSGLTSVTIPNSVTSIGNFAFGGCSGLTSISYTGTKSQYNSITKGTGWHGGVPATVIHCSDGDTPI